jgi:hypothetical protein
MQDLEPLQCRPVYLLLHILFYFLRHGRCAEEKGEKTAAVKATTTKTTTTTTTTTMTKQKYT